MQLFTSQKITFFSSFSRSLSLTSSIESKLNSGNSVESVHAAAVLAGHDMYFIFVFIFDYPSKFMIPGTLIQRLDSMYSLKSHTFEGDDAVEM